MCTAILAMIVVDDNDAAADKHLIANLDIVSCSDMHKLTNANVSPNHDSWREGLVTVLGDCFEPQPCLGGEVVANAN